MKRIIWTQDQIDLWNSMHPIGTPCEFRISFHDSWMPTKTRSVAWLVGDGTPVVKVDGKSGCYGLVDFVRVGGAK